MQGNDYFPPHVYVASKSIKAIVSLSTSPSKGTGKVAP